MVAVSTSRADWVAPAGSGLRPGAMPGSWQLGGVDGPLLAPIGFRERTEALSLAARSPEPARLALAHLRALALRREGLADPRALDLAVLHLAAAEDGDTLPGFAETALCVARGAGLGLAEIAAAPAAEIDAMARALLPAAEDDGTTRIVFAAGLVGDGVDEVAARLASLLRRAVARPAPTGAAVPRSPVAEPAMPATGAPGAAWVVPPAGAAAASAADPPPVEPASVAAQSDMPPPAALRPFRLAPPRAAPRPDRARTEAVGASGASLAPPPGRPALALVPPARPASLPTDAPFLARPLPAGSGLMPVALRTAAPFAVPDAAAQARGEQESPPADALRLPGWPLPPQAEPRPAAPADLAWSPPPPDIADALAAALDDEAELRGLAP
jgi:hypothetical protein